ncbi:MAG: hypothetical protein Kow0069_29980 [Promethearchaeota archaeon]
MPLGLVLIKWDNEIGPVLLMAAPPSFKPTDNLLTRVYSAHRYQSLAPGHTILTLKSKKVVSFFSGMGENFVGVPNYVVALVIRRDERTQTFLPWLEEKAKTVLENVKNEKYKKLLPKLYKEATKIS